MGFAGGLYLYTVPDNLDWRGGLISATFGGLTRVA
jgi:hypothetical protein